VGRSWHSTTELLPHFQQLKQLAKTVSSKLKSFRTNYTKDCQRIELTFFSAKDSKIVALISVATGYWSGYICAMKTTSTCQNCGSIFQGEKGEINRARKLAAPLYCGMRCSGLGRRKYKTVTQKKEEKRLYDIAYRANNRDMLKRRKAAYFQRTYDPAKAAIHRSTRMQYHVEYCRRPEYRAKKKIYDRQYLATKQLRGIRRGHHTSLRYRNRSADPHSLDRSPGGERNPKQTSNEEKAL
jgi:hypothetical protein